jgi:Bromodomain
MIIILLTSFSFFNSEHLILYCSFIRAKISGRKYPSLEALADDLYLMFDNCQLYNELDSLIGRASAMLKRLLKSTMEKLSK